MGAVVADEVKSGHRVHRGTCVMLSERPMEEETNDSLSYRYCWRELLCCSFTAAGPNSQVQRERATEKHISVKQTSKHPDFLGFSFFFGKPSHHIRAGPRGPTSDSGLREFMRRISERSVWWEK